MTWGRDEPRDDGTNAMFSSPEPGSGATEKHVSDPDLDSVVDSSGDGLPSFSEAPARSPYATASEAGAGPDHSDAFATGLSGIDGPIIPGQVLFGRYQVKQKLGDGGMGEVWKVRHLVLGSDRALKLILPKFAIHEAIRVRFGREARFTARLSHENIVVVHDARLSGDAAYIEMEFIRGQSLNKLLRPGVPMPLDWIARITDQLCDALQEAHDHRFATPSGQKCEVCGQTLEEAHEHKQPIVHRDLKPSNLMLVDGRPPGKEFLKVLDFGIAKILGSDNQDSGGHTVTEGFLGTVQYASPEQLLAQPVDGRSDIYATGVLLYEFLTGVRPFGGPAMEQMHGHAYLPPPSMATKNPQAVIPPEVERVVMRCLAKDPAQRPQTPHELADELLQALAKAGVSSPSLPQFVVPPVVDRLAPTDPATPAAATPGPRQEPTAKTAAMFGPRLEPDSFAGAPTGRSSGSYPAVGPYASAAEAALLEGPITDERPKLKPKRSRSFWLLVLTGLAGIVVSVLLLRPDRPPVDLPDGISPEARTALLRWVIEGFEAESPAVLVEGWPKALVRMEDKARFLRHEGERYLPEGYEPEGPAVASDGWPAVLLRRRGQGQPPVRFPRIPEGSFRMGLVKDDQGPVDPNAPERPVSLSGFYIQEFEVTNGEVEDAYKSLGVAEPKQPEEWRRNYEDLSREFGGALARDHPAVYLKHRDAELFARWAKGRLPTEAQWEYTARSGGKDQRFVAGIDGNKPLESQVNISSFGTGTWPTAPGGGYLKDRTERGVFDLSGNVREWCRDVWEPFVAAKAALLDPTGPPRSAGADFPFVTRGGSFNTPVSRALTIERSGYEPETQEAKDLGFRLVLECPSTSRPAVPVVPAR